MGGQLLFASTFLVGTLLLFLLTPWVRPWLAGLLWLAFVAAEWLHIQQTAGSPNAFLLILNLLRAASGLLLLVRGRKQETLWALRALAAWYGVWAMVGWPLTSAGLILMGTGLASTILWRRRFA